MKRMDIAKELIAVAELLSGKKGEVPEAFKKEWKNKDKDGDGKENEPKPDFLKKKEKKARISWVDSRYGDLDDVAGDAVKQMNNSSEMVGRIKEVCEDLKGDLEGLGKEESVSDCDDIIRQLSRISVGIEKGYGQLQRARGDIVELVKKLS